MLDLHKAQLAAMLRAYGPDDVVQTLERLMEARADEMPKNPGRPRRHLRFTAFQLRHVIRQMQESHEAEEEAESGSA